MEMTRRELLKAAGTGVALAAAGPLWSFGASSESRPNIILCMADDQGWGDVGYYNHPVLKTPNLDEMAKVSIRFDRFYAAAPVCSPTRGSVLTGRNPNRFGCFSWGNTLRPQEITIAEALRADGYVTGHFGKWHLGSVRKGSPVNPGASGFDEWFSSPNFFDNNPILSREGKAVQTTGESSMVTVDAALEFIEKHSQSQKPFLAVVWFGSPHDPHKASGENLALYKDQGNKGNFYGEIAGIDRAMGKLRKALRTSGIHENTMLWYCSDNGGLKGLGVTGGRGHKGEIYEGGLRIPALLEWPARIKKGFVSGVPCNTSDIYPTLVDITGARVENQLPLDGISLTPLIAGTMQTRPTPMGFWERTKAGVSTPSDKWMAELLQVQKQGKEPEDQSRLCLNAGDITKQYPEDVFPGHAAWLDWPWKFHRIGKAKELYDLEKDPLEKNNLVGTEPARVKTMESQLLDWQKSVTRSLNGKDYR